MNNLEFVEKLVTVATNYKTLYASGMFGWPLTDDAIDTAKGDAPYWYNEHKKKEDNLRECCDRGYFGFDCVCLVKAILWGWSGDYSDFHGGSGYKINGMEDIPESEVLEMCYPISTVFDPKLMKPGEFLWKGGHCGIYIGDNLAVECAGGDIDKTCISRIGNIKSSHNPNVPYVTTWEKHGYLPKKCIEYLDWNCGSRFYLNKKQYCIGEPIKVMAYNLSSEFVDPFVEIRRDEIADPYLNNWCYIANGKTDLPYNSILDQDKTYCLTMQSVSNVTSKPTALPAGKYIAILHKNKNTVYSRIQFEIINKKQNPEIVAAWYADNSIEVSIKGELSDNARIRVYRKSQKVFNDSVIPIAWHYTNDVPVCYKGDILNTYHYTVLRMELPKNSIDDISNYQVVLFQDDGYTVISRASINSILKHQNESIIGFSSSAKPQLITDKMSCKVGETIEIKFYGANTNSWIGLFPKGLSYSKSSTNMWCYTSSGKQWLGKDAVRNGTVKLSANKRDIYTGNKVVTSAGTYELVLFGDSSTNNILAKKDFLIR